jgi:RNA-dependent RNA polymerase
MEKPVDWICYYLKNDNLGPLSNIHLAYCDKIGPQGCKDPEALKMSSMLQKAVDFAKHGEGISTEQYQECREKLKKRHGEKCWPDFLNKKPEESYESNSVLG